MAALTLEDIEGVNGNGTPSIDDDKARDILRKLLVPDSNKISVIRMHRNMLAKGIPKIQENHPFVSKISFEPSIKTPDPVASTFKDSVPTGLKPIFLNDMEPGKDKVYQKRLLRLTLIEDPMMGFTATNFVVQDDQLIVTRLSIYNIPQNEEYGGLLAFGTELGIINPYHRIAADGNAVIRVDDPDKVIHLGIKKTMCRYCGQEESKSKCAVCQRNYCSRICQLADWKIMKHKLICKKSNE